MLYQRLIALLEQFFFLVFNYYSWHCVNSAHTNVLLHARMSRFTHSMFHLMSFCVNSNSLNLLLFVMNNRNGPTYIDIVHQRCQCFDINRGLGDRGETQVNNGERPGISTARLFLPHGQIMTFDWMWTVTGYLSGETVCVCVGGGVR